MELGRMMPPMKRTTEKIPLSEQEQFYFSPNDPTSSVFRWVRRGRQIKREERPEGMGKTLTKWLKKATEWEVRQALEAGRSENILEEITAKGLTVAEVAHLALNPGASITPRTRPVLRNDWGQRLVGEGEFFRLWMTDKVMARELAPNYCKAFTDALSQADALDPWKSAMKGLAECVRVVQRELHLYYETNKQSASTASERKMWNEINRRREGL